MNCDRVTPELVAYHFGEVSPETRAGLETHLLSCSSCLQAFLCVKRDIETGQLGPRPSPQARSRLRQAVAVELGVAKSSRAWSWWERPLAFGLAASAVLAATATTRVLTSTPGSPPYSLTTSSPSSSPSHNP